MGFSTVFPARTCCTEVYIHERGGRNRSHFRGPIRAVQNWMRSRARSDCSRELLLRSPRNAWILRFAQDDTKPAPDVMHLTQVSHALLALCLCSTTLLPPFFQLLPASCLDRHGRNNGHWRPLRRFSGCCGCRPADWRRATPDPPAFLFRLCLVRSLGPGT